MEEASVGVKIARGFLYVFSRVVFVAVIIAVLVVAYDTAANTLTVDMIIKDAFAKRAQAILMPAADGSDRQGLEQLFTANALSNDPLMQTNPFQSDGYTITSYYERTDINNNIIWSWENSATVSVTEVVRDIRALSHLEPDENGETPQPVIPEWDSGTYSVRVVKSASGSSWMIDSISFEGGVLLDIVSPADVTVPEETPAEEAQPVSPEQPAATPAATLGTLQF
ncbi:MAG: hypothetical protein HDQ87_07075 [Clostridia bacterium]|nr:hypothetical protein [Clostridia bacterium]